LNLSGFQVNTYIVWHEDLSYSLASDKMEQMNSIKWVLMNLTVWRIPFPNRSHWAEIPCTARGLTDSLDS